MIALRVFTISIALLIVSLQSVEGIISSTSRQVRNEQNADYQINPPDAKPQKAKDKPEVFSRKFEKMNGVDLVTKQVFSDAEKPFPSKQPGTSAATIQPTSTDFSVWIILILCAGGITAAALRVIKLQHRVA